MLMVCTGRRVCVGYNVGFQNVWMVAACLLYCFEFEEDKVSLLLSACRVSSARSY